MDTSYKIALMLHAKKLVFFQYLTHMSRLVKYFFNKRNKCEDKAGKNTGYIQKIGMVSKVNKKFISHLTRAQGTTSAAATVQVSHALPAVRFSCLLRGHFPRWRRSRRRLSVCSVLRCVFSKPRTKLTLHCNHRSEHLKTEHTESLFLLRRHLRNCPRGPAVCMRRELLVEHEKLGQLLLMTV